MIHVLFVKQHHRIKHGEFFGRMVITNDNKILLKVSVLEVGFLLPNVHLILKSYYTYFFITSEKVILLKTGTKGVST